MIRIELDEASLGATRIAISPLWDAFCSLHLTMPHRTPSRPYEEWVVRAREVLREDDRTHALRLLIDGPNTFPDFLLPRPVGATSVEAELETVRTTPADVVRAGIAEHYAGLEDHPRIRPYVVDPEAACADLADAYTAYWEGAMAAHWPTMRRLVEDEVLIRARTFATEGIDALFTGLESRAKWKPPVLELTKHIDAEYRAGERRLLLVPLVFAEGCRLYSTDDPEVLTVSFQARGAGALRERPAERAESGDRLGLLLGRGRASVLRQLGGPLTTAGIADRLGLAPSTVSEHLSVLSEADVVTRHRIGRSVYYQLTDTGRALLALLSGEDVLRAVS
ncbi:helix-turn-helix transcriptional regulator [Streptomyces sp. NBC_00338]|uniref:ArsR/SmtB family transcription factor n=1 Tax=Streptomyces sp. NBC_00338 TaxID=2975715 RepID=UPI00225B2417|nr:helix-turn-helix domain-containing protein [Streptomyces sp. NBC_00338]MCX5141129.1 helix-turn-helix domain-containing protein [Streptomyces sp. NBC_00338]